MRKKLIIFCAIICPLVFLVCLIFYRVGVAKQSSRVADPTRKYTVSDYPQVAAEWNSLDYKPLISDSDTATIVNSLFIYRAITINNEQEDDLRKTTLKWINAYRYGSYEAFVAWRLPAEATLDATSLGHFTKWFNTLSKSNASSTAVTPMEIFKFSFESVFAKENKYKMYFQGICLKESSIAVVRHNGVPPKLSKEVMARKNIGCTCRWASFKFKRDIPEVLKEEGSVDVATVILMVKHAPPDPSYPHYLKLFWNSKLKRWIPDEYCFSFVNTAGIKTTPFF